MPEQLDKMKNTEGETDLEKREGQEKREEKVGSPESPASRKPPEVRRRRRVIFGLLAVAGVGFLMYQLGFFDDYTGAGEVPRRRDDVAVLLHDLKHRSHDSHLAEIRARNEAAAANAAQDEGAEQELEAASTRVDRLKQQIRDLEPNDPPAHLSRHLRFQIAGYRLPDPVGLSFRKGDPRIYTPGAEGSIQIVEGSGTARPEPFYSLFDRSLEAMVNAGATREQAEDFLAEVEKARELLLQAEASDEVLEDAEHLDEELVPDSREEPLGLAMAGVYDFAFHPRFPEELRIYVLLAQDESLLLLEYDFVDGNPYLVDYDSERILFRLPVAGVEPTGWQLNFGPDGRLYVAVPALSSQKEQPLYYGSLLAFELQSSDSGKGDSELVPQVVATGLRQPWRFSFDLLSGELYLIDVGEAISELNILSPQQLRAGGLDFGYPNFEGSVCVEDAQSCDQAKKESALSWPNFEYAQGCGLSGGVVYRGELFPELHGHYFFSDNCQGYIRSVRFENGEVKEYYDWSDWVDSPRDFGMFMGWGVDADGELHASLLVGVVLRMVWADSAPPRFLPPDVEPANIASDEEHAGGESSVVVFEE